MKLLILGGTLFVGRHLVEEALARGHTVSLFHRGQTNPNLYPQVEHLHGDRGGELDVLRGRRWDAVVDTCGYVPRVVHASASLLAKAVEHYTFISTLNAYASFSVPQMDERAPLATLDDETIETITDATYGPLKVLCERAVEAAFPGRALIIRPGLIAGPYDPNDRFTYWPYRVAQGGAVLAPGTPHQGIRFLDARDLAAWTIAMAERRQTGVYNASGPATPLPMGVFLDACRAVTGSDATFTWVDDHFLVACGVRPYVELPLWVPDALGPERIGYVTLDCTKAMAAELRFRSVEQTIRDTLAWFSGASTGAPLKAGLAPAREAELLRAWHDQGSSMGE